MFTDKPPCVLLIEDNADDERLMMRALGLNGRIPQVVVARDGESALTLLHGGNGANLRPDLIILDLKIPKISGVELLRKIRGDQRTQAIPVVVLTSSDEVEDIRKCYVNGANSYIRKPINFEEFVDHVRQLEAYWLSVNTSPVALS